jgi:CRP-like cAMP-binding protein
VDASRRSGGGDASAAPTERNGHVNLVLAGLSRADLAELQSKFEPIELGLRDSLYESDEPIEHIYFPLSGVYSLVSPMKGGATVEVATVGKEGFVGVPVFLGAVSTPLEAFCQVSGRCLRITARDFRVLVEGSAPLRRQLQLYTQGLLTQIGQTAACNRAHGVRQRCARWLLMTHERVDSDRFELTHEFLGQMLGVRRASVTEVAGELQNDGLITYSRGVVTILDQVGLERASCECYSIIRNEYRRLLG